MAVPNPEIELGRLQKFVAKGLPPLLVVTGANDFFRGEAVQMALDVVAKDAELRIVDAVDERGGGGGGADSDDDGDGDDTGGETADDGADGLAACPELLDLRGGGLFAKSAVVVVRRGANWWKRHGAVVAGQVARFGKGCGLVVEAAKVDKRKKVVAQLLKALGEQGALFEFRELYELPYDRGRGPLEGELCKWVAGRSTKLGVPLSPEAAWLVIAQVGIAPAELVAELGRLRDQLGDRLRALGRAGALGPEDLRGRITCSFESTPFELAEAVLGGDRRRAYRSVHAMFARGVRGKDGRSVDGGGLLPFATSWMFTQLAVTYEGRLLLDRGVPAADLAGRAGVRQFADRFVEQVRRHDLGQLQRGLLALHNCQRMSRLSGEEPDVLLERFLAQWFDGAPIPTAEDLEL